MQGHRGGLLEEGDAVLFVDRKDREYLRRLQPGKRLHVRGGTLQADHIIGIEEGSVVYNTGREPFRVLRPSFAQLIPNLASPD